VRPALPALVAALVAVGGCAPDETTDDPTTEEQAAPTTEEGTDAGDGAAEEDPATDTGTDGATDAATDTGADEGDTGTDGEAASDEVAGLELTRCQSSDISVDYPASWTFYAGDEVPPCRVFHPEPIEDFQGESLHYAVRLYIDPVDFEDTTDSPLSEEISREETTVDGRDAVAIERRSEGEAMLPEGERSYTYTVDLDGMILVGSTTSVGDTDYERDKRVLDRMMETITVTVHEDP
jgi:hypothetical protein